MVESDDGTVHEIYQGEGGGQGGVLMPLLLGREVKLHPVIIITAVLIFGGIWGFWGLLLAIPIATFLRAILVAWPAKEDLVN